MDNFKGKWITNKSFKVKNYDEFMDQFNVPKLKEAFRNATVEFEYKKADGDKWKLVVNVEGYPEMEYPATPGETIDSVGVDGTPFKAVIQVDGNTMTEEQTFPEKFGKMTRTRTIKGDIMIVETVCKNCTMTEQMKRVK